MKQTEYTLKNGKMIRVVDDLFSYADRAEIYEKAVAAPYKIGWSDTPILELSNYRYLYHAMPDDDLNRSPLLFNLMASPLHEVFEGKDIKKAVINLSHPTDVHFPHSHNTADVLLYYVNLKWELHWFGETMFYDDQASEIELALPYTPGRVAYFERGVPHALRPQSQAAQAFRLTIAIFLIDKGSEDSGSEDSGSEDSGSEDQS
ncbi:hypothetical protein [Aurantiacibacter odishensis]|uniref:hypothetical protein n=1 Tax=Aurantiacibacter odishensis TaxID=1155476 RepID=UPI000E7313AA|nr:hypothetical protein [Aurantiacibacter odishensis]